MTGFFVGLFCGMLLVAAGVVTFNGTKPLDDTDNKVTGERSNMRILIDHGTGCQYLHSAGGGLTPRLDSAGKPICGRPA